MEIMDFWKRIDTKTAEKGLTLPEVSKAAGLNYKTLQQQRRAGRLPKTAEALKLSQVLGVTLEYLTEGKEGAITLSPEALAVNNDETLQALVKACIENKELFFNLYGVLLKRRQQ